MRCTLGALVALVLSACGGDGRTANTAGAAMPAAQGVPCEQEVAFECGAGLVDGCLESDGSGPLTLVHACIAESESAGPPCEQELAKQCPEGQVDACAASPPLARTHVCFRQGAS